MNTFTNVTIEHNTIIEMMKHMGFDDKWRFWTQKILGSGSSAILLNGVPGKQIQCKRRVRQGDPHLFYLLWLLTSYSA